jgi:hypothetical protein
MISLSFLTIDSDVVKVCLVPHLEAGGGVPVAVVFVKGVSQVLLVRWTGFAQVPLVGLGFNLESSSLFPPSPGFSVIASKR